MLQFLQQIFGPFAATALVAIRVLSILILGALALRFIDSALKRVFSLVAQGGAIRTARLDQRAETLRQIVRSVSRVIVGVVVFLWITSELGYDIQTLLTGAGIAAVAFAFGAQALVKDIIAGFFILLEDQYGVGDVVRIGSQDGVVEHMTLRITVLRNMEGHVHVIANGNIQSVTVLTKDWSRAVIDITVSPKENLDRVFESLRRVAAALAADMPARVLEKPQVLGIERLSDEGVTIRSIVKTPPTQTAEVLREWRRRIKDAFDREGIEMPQKIALDASRTQRTQSGEQAP